MQSVSQDSLNITSVILYKNKSKIAAAAAEHRYSKLEICPSRDYSQYEVTCLYPMCILSFYRNL
jgi:hypothetical protein